MDTLPTPSPTPSLSSGPSALATALDRLQASLQDALGEHITTAEFCRRARADMAFFTALPPRYMDVLHPLLDRLESSALFTEESCSFSQRDQFASLQMWLDKARKLAN
jgi:hypothetical protein